MRVRNVLTVLGAATLLAGAIAAPASAGTGSANWCRDGLGYREISVLSSPVTVGVEIGPGTGANNHVIVCYSTAPAGDSGNVTGGAVVVDIDLATATAAPGARAELGCYPDFVTGVGPSCYVINSADAAPADLKVETPASSICLVSLGSGCVAYVPGVKLTTGADPRPLLSIDLLGYPLAADLPQQCVAVVVTCP